ncbi:MAG: hypothetical protein ACLQFR_26070 [Streptosporangiaceae bacterium]
MCATGEQPCAGTAAGTDPAGAGRSGADPAGADRSGAVRADPVPADSAQALAYARAGLAYLAAVDAVGLTGAERAGGPAAGPVPGRGAAPGGEVGGAVGVRPGR